MPVRGTDDERGAKREFGLPDRNFQIEGERHREHRECIEPVLPQNLIRPGQLATFVDWA
jgi:hypothetical protein